MNIVRLTFLRQAYGENFIARYRLGCVSDRCDADGAWFSPGVMMTMMAVMRSHTWRRWHRLAGLMPLVISACTCTPFCFALHVLIRCVQSIRQIAPLMCSTADWSKSYGAPGRARIDLNNLLRGSTIRSTVAAKNSTATSGKRIGKCGANEEQN